MDIYHVSDVHPRERYREFLRVPALSAPHREDEIYYVTSGRGMIRVGTEDRPIEPGSIVYVPPRVDHRFHAITEELRVLVVFAPAETSPA